MVGVVIADHIRVTVGVFNVNNFLSEKVLSMLVGQLALHGDRIFCRFNLGLLLSLLVPT